MGKGGVGKSALAEGMAFLAAERGRRTLLVRIGEEVSAQAATAASGAPRPSEYGFDVVDLDAREAMDEYVRRVVRIQALARRVIGSDVYRKFFAAAPGLPELVLLGRIQAYSLESGRDARPRWQTLIVDSPSSGHGLLMLETPAAAFRAVSRGPFARLAGGIMDWLRRTAKIIIVAIPEEMAVAEAIELKDELLERTGLAPTASFLNRLRRESLSPAARLALAEIDPPPKSLDRSLVESARRAQRRTRLETFHQRRLALGLGLSPILIPELPNPGTEALAAAIDGAIG